MCEPGSQRAELRHPLALGQERLGRLPALEQYFEHRSDRGDAGIHQRLDLGLGNGEELDVGPGLGRSRSRGVLEERHLADDLSWLADRQEHLTVAGPLDDLDLPFGDDEGSLPGGPLGEQLFTCDQRDDLRAVLQLFEVGVGEFGEEWNRSQRSGHVRPFRGTGERGSRQPRPGPPQTPPVERRLPERRRRRRSLARWSPSGRDLARAAIPGPIRLPP